MWWQTAGRVGSAIALVGLVQAVARAGPPDLSISRIAVATSQPVAGQDVLLDVLVHNGGEALAGDVTVTTWSDGEAAPADADNGLNQPAFTGLASSTDRTVRVTLNGYPRPGHYRAWIWIDVGASLADGNRANNLRSVDLTVGDPQANAGGSTDQAGGEPAGGSNPGGSDSASTAPVGGLCGLGATGPLLLAAAVLLGLSAHGTRPVR
jgi:hypothetical protein